MRGVSIFFLVLCAALILFSCGSKNRQKDRKSVV